MKDSLYEKIGLRRFATASEVKQRIDELLGKQRSEEQEHAMSILCDAQQRAVYDAVLRAADGKELVSFGDAEMILTATKLAKQLGFSVLPGPNEHAIRVAWATEGGLTTPTNFIGGKESCRLGVVEIQAVAFNCTIQRVERGGCVATLESGKKVYCQGMQGNKGETGGLAFVSLGGAAMPACHVRGLTGVPLIDAGIQLFDQQDVANAYQIRNKRARIQSLVLFYYDWLAGFAASQWNVDKRSLRGSFFKFAKSNHPCFP